MNNSSVYHFLNSFLIENLVELEILLENQTLSLFKKDEEVIIKLDRVFLRNISYEEIERYSDYSYRWFEHGAAYFQKINYEDFLPFQSDFLERVDSILEKLEIEILRKIKINIDLQVEKGIKSESYLNHIIDKIERTNSALLEDFSQENEYIIRHYNTKSSNPYITEAMHLVTDNQKNLQERVLSEFSKFLDSSSSSLKQEEEFPDFFKSLKNYQNFINYLEKNSKDNLFKVISYGWKRMIFEENVHKITDMAFAHFLKEKGIIDDELFNKIIIKGQFDSIKKSKSKARINSYNDIIFT